jgi:hypothetical protein
MADIRRRFSVTTLRSGLVEKASDRGFDGTGNADGAGNGDTREYA